MAKRMWPTFSGMATDTISFLRLGLSCKASQNGGWSQGVVASPPREPDRPRPKPGTLHSASTAVYELEGRINWRLGRLGVASVGGASRLRAYKSAWQTLWQQRFGAFRAWKRPGAGAGLSCWFVVEPPPESNRRPHPCHRCAGSSRPLAGPHVTTQPPRSKPQLRGRSWGDARLRVAQFLANLWQRRHLGGVHLGDAGAGDEVLQRGAQGRRRHHPRRGDGRRDGAEVGEVAGRAAPSRSARKKDVRHAVGTESPGQVLIGTARQRPVS